MTHKITITFFLLNLASVSVTSISHDEMETKVRLHRKNLKQAEFLKRQAEKERRELAKEDSDRSESKTSNENFIVEKEPSPPPSPSPENSDSENNIDKSVS